MATFPTAMTLKHTSGVMLDEQYYSQLSNEELENRLLQLLDTDRSTLTDLQGAVLAVEAVAIAGELKRRGVPVSGPDGRPIW